MPPDPIREPELVASGMKPVETVDIDGNFRIAGSFAGAVRIDVDPMPRGMLVKKVFYNGVEAGNTFLPNPYAVGQSLTILLTDKPAHLTGTVYREANPEAGARARSHRAVAASMTDDFPQYEAVESDPDGQFAVDLGAGTYRVAGVDAAAWERAEMPDVLARWIASG